MVIVFSCPSGLNLFLCHWIINCRFSVKYNGFAQILVVIFGPGDWKRGGHHAVVVVVVQPKFSGAAVLSAVIWPCVMEHVIFALGTPGARIPTLLLYWTSPPLVLPMMWCAYIVNCHCSGLEILGWESYRRHLLFCANTSTWLFRCDMWHKKVL